MNEEKHCDTCDCHARVCGIKRHKLVKFFLYYGCIPYIFVSICIFTFHVDQTFSEKYLPMYWMLMASVIFNWFWILMAVLVPISNDVKLLIQGCGELLMDPISRFWHWSCSPFRYFYNQTLLLLQRRVADGSRIYSLEHVVADSPEASPEMNVHEEPPKLPEKQGSIVAMRDPPIVYDLPPRFKRHSRSPSDAENSPRRVHQAAGLSDTSPKSGLARGATGGLTETIHTGGATGFTTQTSNIGGVRKKTRHIGGNTGTRSKTRASGQTAPSASNLGIAIKTSPMTSSYGTGSEASSSDASLGAKPKSKKCIFPDTKRSLAAKSFGKTIDETENVDDSICQLDLSHINVHISLPSSVTEGQTTHGSHERDLSSDTSHASSRSSNADTLRNNPQGMSLAAAQTGSRANRSGSSYIPFVPDTRKQNPEKFSIPDPIHTKHGQIDSSNLQSNSSQILTSFGKAIDETENIDDSICQLDLSHINVPISLASSEVDCHSIPSPSKKELSTDIRQSSQSSNTEHVRNNQQTMSFGASQITTDTRAKQSTSYIPFISDNQQNPKILKIPGGPISFNSQSSEFKQDSVEIKVSDSTLVRMKPHSSPSDPIGSRFSPDPSRVRMSPQSSPSDHSRVRMSPQSSSDPKRVRMSPQSSPSDPTRVRMSPQSSPNSTRVKISSRSSPSDRISPLAFPSDRPTLRISPDTSMSDSTRFRTSPKILKLETKETSCPEPSGVRQIQSSYVPFVPDKRGQNNPIVTLSHFDVSTTPHTRANITSEHHETNLFTSSFGKTIDLTENIDTSILQLDASHIHVQIFPRTEISLPQLASSKYTSQISPPGSPHLKTSPLASAPGSPHLKTSPLASAPGSPLRLSKPVHRVDSQGSASSFVHLETSPKTSVPPQAPSYVPFVPNQPSTSRDFKILQSDASLQSSTEGRSENIPSDRKDKNRSIDNFADNGRPGISNNSEGVLKTNACVVQTIAEGQIDDSTRTNATASTNCPRNNIGIDNNLVVEGQTYSSLSSSSLSSYSDRNNLEGLRLRIRTVSEKCEIEKSESMSVTTRSKTF